MVDYLIKYCAPTLANLKTANLFNYPFYSEKALRRELWDLNHLVNKKGIFVTVLMIKSGKALIYVYRRSRLAKDLDQAGVRNYLSPCGYPEGELKKELEFLINRFREYEEFPHEIGLFLGYPILDVVGFTYNAGKNYRLNGYWKVYQNVNDTEKLFRSFKQCQDNYYNAYINGSSLNQLAVLA